MYANLRIQVNDEEPFYAHEVVIEEEGRVLVRLDAQDGEGDVAVPAGEKLMHPGDRITISADF